MLFQWITWPEIYRLRPYAEIRLDNIIVFHNGHRVGLGNHSAINYCRFLEISNTISLTPTNHHLYPCRSLRKRVKQLSIMATEGTVKEHVIRQKMCVKSDMLDFSFGCWEVTTISVLRPCHTTRPICCSWCSHSGPTLKLFVYDK